MDQQNLKKVEFMTLSELSVESLRLKKILEENPNDFGLNDRLSKVTIERKKKNLKNLLKDLEFGGTSFFYTIPEIKTLKEELTSLGVNVPNLEAEFVRQSLYI